ncbi:MAG TPA: DUF2950 family protein, partial [Rubrivivax sp.]|nr:DUF2950 family protein [Rubrivivax sp.]
GVMTFIVNQDGIVYQRSLGPNTDALARAMKTFDPDSSWQKAQPGKYSQTLVDARFVVGEPHDRPVCRPGGAGQQRLRRRVAEIPVSICNSGAFE